MTMMNDLVGIDAYGQPKANYVTKISAMDDGELADECETKLWISVLARNPLSDSHWQIEALHAECEKRPQPETYERAQHRVGIPAE